MSVHTIQYVLTVDDQGLVGDIMVLTYFWYDLIKEVVRRGMVVL